MLIHIVLGDKLRDETRDASSLSLSLFVVRSSSNSFFLMRWLSVWLIKVIIPKV